MIKLHLVDDSWKVPFRSVYADTFIGMLKQTLWCHVVARAFPGARDLASDVLASHYFADPSAFFEQYKRALRRPRCASCGEQVPLGAEARKVWVRRCPDPNTEYWLCPDCQVAEMPPSATVPPHDGISPPACKCEKCGKAWCEANFTEPAVPAPQDEHSWAPQTMKLGFLGTEDEHLRHLAAEMLAYLLIDPAMSAAPNAFKVMAVIRKVLGDANYRREAAAFFLSRRPGLPSNSPVTRCQMCGDEAVTPICGPCGAALQATPTVDG